MYAIRSYYALVPALLFGMYNVGYQHFKAIGELTSTGFFQIFIFGLLKVLPIVIVSYVVGLGIEFVFAQIRGHEIQEGFLVSGMLIPLVMPVETPLWIRITSYNVCYTKLLRNNGIPILTIFYVKND